MDDDAQMLNRHGMHCLMIANQQLCRNSLEQLGCVDDSVQLTRHIGVDGSSDFFLSCSHALEVGGCMSSSHVTRWCPKACGSCPTTFARDVLLTDARLLCKRSCGLCPGDGWHDCQGSFSGWGKCETCKRHRVFKVSQPRRTPGEPCPFADGAVEVKDCCGLATRWRVVAASPLPSFWEVVRLTFYQSGDCSGYPLGITVDDGPDVAAGTGVGIPLEDLANWSAECTPDNIGPIASGSEPAPFGCQSALLVSGTGDTWRSGCGPCTAGEAWLGFRTPGAGIEVHCAELLHPSVLGTDGALQHVPAVVRLERWNGKSWQVRAQARPRPGELRVLLQVPANLLVDDELLPEVDWPEDSGEVDAAAFRGGFPTAKVVRRCMTIVVVAGQILACVVCAKWALSKERRPRGGVADKAPSSSDDSDSGDAEATQRTSEDEGDRRPLL